MDFHKLEELKALLLSKFDAGPAIDAVKACSIVINPKMRSTAGRAFYRSNEIHLNERLLVDNPAQIEPTFAHELAHLISVALYGPAGRGHGANWKRIMRQLGYEPDRTHNMDVSAYARKHAVKAVARCGCRSSIPLKAGRVNKIKRGAKYRCLKCNHHLEIVDFNLKLE